MQQQINMAYWGIYDNTLYWANTLEALKLQPTTVQLDNAQIQTFESGGYCMIKNQQDSEMATVIGALATQVALTEDYKMLQILLKSVIIGVTPKVIDLALESLTAVSDAVTGFFSPEVQEPAELPKHKKTPDTTKLTQYMYDFILHAYGDWKNFNAQNPRNKKTMEELVETINTYMGTNKSRTSLGRVWNGHIDRAYLPTGTAYFNYPHKDVNLP